jgi:hypothetical protein
MAVGMGLIGGGILWTTSAPVDGRFWHDLAGPFFVTGAGTAFAFIPISIAALAGVEGREAGLASGLLNTSQQIGGAIGVAIASTVAATHFQTLVRPGGTRERCQRVSAGVLGLRRVTRGRPVRCCSSAAATLHHPRPRRSCAGD